MYINKPSKLIVLAIGLIAQINVMILRVYGHANIFTFVTVMILPGFVNMLTNSIQCCYEKITYVSARTTKRMNKTKYLTFFKCQFLIKQ